jgi:hypothetical protein
VNNLKSYKQERLKIMSVRLARHLNLSQVETFEDLPEVIRQHFEGLRYCDLVRPLIILDRSTGMSIRQIGIKYGLSKTAISNCIQKSNTKVRTTNVDTLSGKVR